MIETKESDLKCGRMILPNNTGGFMLQTMLYLANQQSANHTLNDLYNLPPGLTPGGGLYFN